jgi:hypothetical protein
MHYILAAQHVYRNGGKKNYANGKLPTLQISNVGKLQLKYRNGLNH